MFVGFMRAFSRRYAILLVIALVMALLAFGARAETNASIGQASAFGA